MKLLHNIGVSPSKDPRIASNYNTREEILACTEPLSFDGVYLNVWENRDVLEGKDVTLFIMGDYIDGDNIFDEGMPYEKYCGKGELFDLHMMGCKIGWHTWSHPDLTTLGWEELENELANPFFADEFAYPYGRYDADVIEAVKKAGYKRAWSVTQGNDEPYSLLRTYL